MIALVLLVLVIALGIALAPFIGWILLAGLVVLAIVAVIFGAVAILAKIGGWSDPPKAPPSKSAD